VDLSTSTVGAGWNVEATGTLRMAYGRVDNQSLIFISNGSVFNADSSTKLPNNYSGSVGTLDVSENGQILCVLTGFSPGFVKCYQLQYSTLEGGILEMSNLGSLNTGSNPKDVSLTRDGLIAYTASGAPYGFRGFDLVTMSTIHTLSVGTDCYPNNVEISSLELLYGGSDGKVWIYNIDGVEQNNYHLAGPGKEIRDRQLVISGDGTRMIVSTNDPTIQMLTAP
jgi:hypothetical protein